MARWDPAARRRWMTDGGVAVGVGAAQVGAAWAVSGHRGQSIEIFRYVCLAAAGRILAARRRIVVHFDAVVEAAGLDRDRARDWVVLRAADYLRWGLDHGLTEDPLRCRRLLAALV